MVSSIRVAAKYLIATSYFNVGDFVVFGKWKNKRGRVVRIFEDERGIPYIEIEPIPKGRKSNRVLSLFTIRKMSPEAIIETKQIVNALRTASNPPVLYRGISLGIKYTGFNWHANMYLTDDLETAAIYGRFGKTQRIIIPSSLNIVKADHNIVRDIEASYHPEKKAKELGVQAIWNDTNTWVGKVHPHEFILFDSTKAQSAPLTKTEQIVADRIRIISK